ncbi:MAG: PD-(D/E)XK nuclease family protein [Chloroflexota bacterium]|nr:PD-(D/E)XK nuclease family protein [Chloroflexota bacterium]
MVGSDGSADTRDRRDYDALTALIVNNPELDRLEALQRQFNIFEALGVVRQEVRHSDFLAFLLDPSQSHGVGDAFVKRLLQRLLADADLKEPVSPLDISLWSLGDLEVYREWQHVDLLLVSEKNQFVVLIENKIGSGEHSNQLARYLQAVRNRYQGWRTLALYLTPDANEPSNDAYLPIDYTTVADVVDGLSRLFRPSLDSAVYTVMTHYASLLRSHVVTDSEIARLCRQIYQQHRRALDLIFEHRPDSQSTMKDFLVLELPRFGGHLIIGHSVPVRRCSRVAHPPDVSPGLQGRSRATRPQ